jgi:transcriptional regulator GlxA family with amidase domain
MSNSPTILFLAYEGMGLLDVTGPLTVFWSASEFMVARGHAGYTRHIVSLKGGLIRTAEGVALDTMPIDKLADVTVDTIIVPGALDIVPVLQMRPLIDWIRTNAPIARRTASVCGGAFLLAEAGLLDGRRAATHWALCDQFKDRFPAVEVERDAIFVREDPIWTSAGVSAGIDLSLALIQDDCGREIAMQVARQLVIYLKRPGGQSQFSELLISQAQDTAAFDDLHVWISANLGKTEMSVDALAEKAHMSPRNFARTYKLRTGRTPAKAVEIFRLEAAKRLLEESDDNIDQIARACGFGDEERMRVTFNRNVAISPRDYRKRFSVLP